ncbi:MAG: methylmalonyl-CoA epimerase [Albidovulum sp.]|nr:methylmalonyl-CoA epimerase [Albidovulum sp.]
MNEISPESKPLDISAIEHVAIAVPDLENAIEFYKSRFGANVGDPVDIPSQSIRIACVEFANAKIELMQPLEENSAVGKFLARNPAGGLHHICFATGDADRAYADADSLELRPLGPPSKGYHGRPLFFLHPKAAMGTLIEIEEAAEEQL